MYVIVFGSSVVLLFLRFVFSLYFGFYCSCKFSLVSSECSEMMSECEFCYKFWVVKVFVLNEIFSVVVS